MTPPVCDCHGQPKRWHTDALKTQGGYWRCAVKVRERERRRYATNPELEKARERMRRNYYHRYDNDPVWRIERNLKRARELRAVTLARRRQQLEEERVG